MGSMKVDERANQELRKQNEEILVLVKLLKEQLEQKDAIIEFFKNKVKSMESTISEYKKIIFGSRSEKRHFDESNQLIIEGILPQNTPENKNIENFDNESEQNSNDEPQQNSKPDKQHKKSRKGRRSLPKRLPHRVEEYDVAKEERICSKCGHELRHIGCDENEVLDYIPAHYEVIKIKKHKYGHQKP